MTSDLRNHAIDLALCQRRGQQVAILELLGRHGVRYLIIGGLAFIYHAKPRFTKDIVRLVLERRRRLT